MRVLLLSSLLVKDHCGPCFAASQVLSNGLGQDSHPLLLLSGRVGVEINDFSIGETDAEAFFDKHVAFFLFGKRRLATATTLGLRWLLQCTLVVN
jgi:hypothetical protein